MARQGNGFEMFGHYDAGDTGRLMNDWATSYGTPYGNLKSQWKNVVARSQRAMDNNPYATSVQTTLANNVIGQGMRPTPRVKTFEGRPIEGVNDQLAEGWKRYNDELDATGQETFYEMQKTILNQIVSDGGVLLNRVTAAPGSYLGVQYQTLSILRLDTDQDADNAELSDNPNVKQTVFGINLTENGAPVSYYIQGMKKAIPATNIFHAYRKMKVEQFLAPPWLIPALKYLWYNEKLLEDRIIASRIQAMIGLFVPSATLWDQILAKQTASTSDTTNPTQLKMEPGRVYHGRTKDDKPEVIQADDNVTAVLEPLTRLILHAVCVTQGISYQTVTRDLQKVNMASARVNTNGDRRAFRMFQKWFAKAICQRVWNNYVERMVFEGKIHGVTVPQYIANPWHYQQCQWRPTGFDYIDPSREAAAAVELHDNNMLTLEQHYGERGEYWRDSLAQIAEERKVMKELGIEKQEPTGGFGAQRPANANDGSADDEDEDGDDMESRLSALEQEIDDLKHGRGR